MNETNDMTPLGYKILDHWKLLSPDDGAGPGAGEPTAAGGLRRSGTDGESPVRAGGSAEDGVPGGVGDRDEGVGVPPRRTGSTPAIVRSGDARPAPTLARDFRITSAHEIGAGGLKEKAHANLAAIRTLKSIEAENRDATIEERNLLAKYAGWGALPNVFEANPPREWKTIAGELREVLSPEEYASARASTPNAHYTSPEVIAAVWQALDRFGLKAGAQSSNHR